MKKKIAKHIYLVGALCIILSTFLTSLVYFKRFEEQIFKELHIYADFIEGIYMDYPTEVLNQVMSKDSIRVSIIARDGKVSYDNQADISILENHGNRPEVRKAFSDGEAESIRKSKTLAESSYYYARSIQSDQVIRIGTQSKSMLFIFFGALPVIIICNICLFVVCVLLTRMLTIRILKPVEEFAKSLNGLENIREQVPYEEIVPFVTTILEQHDSIKDQLIRLKQSESVRQEFTANVSHELKTPLTAISGYAELMEHGMVREEDIKHFASEIRRNSNRLLTLINDIIQLSELEETNRQITKEEVDLYEVAEECLKNLTIKANHLSITIELIGEHCIVNANKRMMEDMFTNLCDNAVKYNRPGGSVLVSIQALDGYAEVLVQDTGIGIEIEHQERIFERFYRVDKSRSKATGGTGLGLAIVKHILANHQALIELMSVPKQGTSIRILLPKHGE